MCDDDYEDETQEQDYESVEYEMAGRALLVAALEQGLDIESLVQDAKGDILDSGQSRIAGHPHVTNSLCVLDEWLEDYSEEFEEE